MAHCWVIDQPAPTTAASNMINFRSTSVTCYVFRKAMDYDGKLMHFRLVPELAWGGGRNQIRD